MTMSEFQKNRCFDLAMDYQNEDLRNNPHGYTVSLHSNRDTTSDAFEAGYCAATEHAQVLVEAIEMGAFHHDACASNWYADNTIKKDWNGFGEHREVKACNCARARIEEALKKWRGKVGC